MFDQAVRLMTRGLGSTTSGAGEDVVMYELANAGPGVVSSHKISCLVDSEVSGEEVVVTVL